MKFKVDHDYHIHSRLSLCSGNPDQTPTTMMAYAKKNGYKSLCITDHFWDEKVPGAWGWYEPQNWGHIQESLPLPQDIPFYFGAETELRKDMTLGISPETMEKLAFIIIPTAHLHMGGFTIKEGATDEEYTMAWINRFDGVLDMDLPFEKIGIPHLSGSFVQNKDQYERIMNGISDEELYRLFTKAAKVGAGIEINAFHFRKTSIEYEQSIRIFTIAKKCGCKFYLGSDAHNPWDFDDTFDVFENAVEVLGLTEEDKFRPFEKKTL